MSSYWCEWQSVSGNSGRWVNGCHQGTGWNSPDGCLNGMKGDLSVHVHSFRGSFSVGADGGVFPSYSQVEMGIQIGWQALMLLQTLFRFSVIIQNWCWSSNSQIKCCPLNSLQFHLSLVDHRLPGSCFAESYSPDNSENQGENMFTRNGCDFSKFI